MKSLITKSNPKIESVMQWHTQAGNITTDLRVKIDLTLPEICVMKIVTWNCHIDDSGRYLLT